MLDSILSLNTSSNTRKPLDRKAVKTWCLTHGPSFLLIIIAVLIAFADVLGADRGLMFRDHADVFKPRLWELKTHFGAFEFPSLTQADP